MTLSLVKIKLSKNRNLPSQPEINIGTAGHVDHGKTTLVEAITGVWTSAHSEELKRGITIKVGYADAAFYKCPSCLPPMSYSTSPKCPYCGSNTELLRVVSFVDCPGHEALMTNMLSGAALMDGAILVIATDERVPQPQTREHLLALQMLGLKHIVIAQNKVDLVSYEDALSNFEKIKSFVADSIAKDAPIIPVSAQHKLNIDAMIEAIEKFIPTPERKPDALPLMHVLRSFDINRPGASIDELKGGVVGGTLLQGEIKSGDEIELRPGKINERTSKYESIFTSVASLGTSAGLVNKVKPGGLIAIGTNLDPYMTKGDALVGQVLGKPESLPPIHEEISLDVALFEVVVGAPEMVKVEKMKMNEALRLNVGTAVTLGNVSSIKGDRIDVMLKRPISAPIKSRVAISRRIADRWRLIGSGIIG
ncbi:MAG: translation initiation factor IF-2 subunit gamma [archaeon]|nr:translation initiation factor IF-2 subunit gamma [archaeon]MCP8314298.1 translation initiation factor IF-2 subunit gamma [archaeon]MCP8317125.1 translation initiation factor IF-2 subunit gamma [archaeon]